MSELPRNMKELLRHFPRKIPKEFRQEIKEKAAPRILYCYDKEDRQKAICTCCGKKVVIPRHMRHKEETVCPKCSKKGYVVHTWRANVHRFTPILSYHFAKSEIDPDVITCMAIYTEYIGYSDTPWKDEPFQVIDAYYVFIPGKGAVMAADRHKIYNDAIVIRHNQKPKYPYNINPYIRSSVRARENIYNMSYGYSCVYVCFPSKYDISETVKGTSIEYAWEAYKDTVYRTTYEDTCIKLLEHICRGPLAMEYLAKIGLDEMIYRAVMGGMGICRAFNLKADTLDKITRGRLSKEEKKYLWETRGKAGAPTFEAFQTWQMVKKLPGGRHISLMEAVKNIGYATKHELSSLEYVRYEKLMRYLEKQKTKYQNYRITLDMYADYIQGCVTLGADMKSKSTLWPADLITAHDHQRSQIQIRKSELEEAKYQERKDGLKKKYSFEAMGFVIVVPDKVHDLIREGTDMHNCVGNYIKRVANGETCVVYIRKGDALNESFGTMEINKTGTRIIQARGKYNKDLPKEAQAFVAAFEKAKINKNKKERKAA